MPMWEALVATFGSFGFALVIVVVLVYITHKFD